MIETVEYVMKKLPPVKGKNAALASIIGLAFGGLGLAIWFGL
jgi:hypothetical protein